MKGTEIVKAIMREKGITQQELANRLGYASQSGIAGRLNAQKISVAALLSMLKELGYELVIREEGKPDGEEWKVTE